MALPLILAARGASLAASKSKATQAKSLVSGMNINMTSNADAVQKALQGFSKQFPFAMSQALNDTAFQVRKEIVEKTYPQSFTVRNKRFAGTMFRVDKATKKNLRASVFDRLGKDYMTDQAEGGIKTPRGNSVAIPARAIKRTSSGKIGKAKQPRNLLNNGKAYRTSLRGGQKAIVQPTGRGKAKRLQVMYLLEPRAVIPKRFPFYEDANRVARVNFDKNFAKAFKRAKATARR